MCIIDGIFCMKWNICLVTHLLWRQGNISFVLCSVFPTWGEMTVTTLKRVSTLWLQDLFVGLLIEELVTFVSHKLYHITV